MRPSCSAAREPLSQPHLTLFSPAKLNLFLRILGRRSDGYHELASLFHTISFGDTLAFSLSSSDQLTCTDPALSCGSDNLITRAVELYRKRSGRSFGVTIQLEKRIPMQAGLGGGSSNAATTLWALNQLLGGLYPTHVLQEWSFELGADLPFFFSKGGAYCTGIGEKIRLIEDLPHKKFSLYQPSFGLETSKVYQALDLQSCSRVDPEELLESFFTKNALYHNDLEPAAFELAPELGHFKQREGRLWTMSGSGSALFAPHSGEGGVDLIRRTEESWYQLFTRD